MAEKNVKFIQYLYKYPTYSSSDLKERTNFELGEDLCNLIADTEKAKEISIISLGIQAPRGTKFFINGSEGVIGSTGRFELNQTIIIKSLIIGTSNDAALYSNIIVDILYHKGV